MEPDDKLPQKLMTLIALLQGLGLLLLHQAIEFQVWPYLQPHWLFALYTIACTLPVMLLLSINGRNDWRVARLTAMFSLVCALLGYYIGLQAVPIEPFEYASLLLAFIITIALATFKALMYMQQWWSGEGIKYSSLFLWSWRNFLTLLLALLFAAAFWAILMLWGALFNAIGISFFQDLFEQRWFYYPVIALAHGVGIIMFRRLTHVIDTITRLQQALTKFLLILVVFVSQLFILALPFTGVAPLWDSGGSILILWMQALMLFFLNTVYQDDVEQRPYKLWLHRFVYVGILLLPIYSIIAFYGLTLRVDQYGWSLARCWGFLVWFLLALFPIGYTWGIIKCRDAWVRHLRRINVGVGLVFLAFMLIVNSPLMDFRKISVASQLDRLTRGEIAIDDFDFWYFKRSLAKPGFDALAELKIKYAANTAVVSRINDVYRNLDPEQRISSIEDLKRKISSEHFELPKSLLEAIYADSILELGLTNAEHYFLIDLDLNDDGQTDYLFTYEQFQSLKLRLYYFEGGDWKNISAGYHYYKNSTQRAQLLDALVNGDVEISTPKWNDFKIGGEKFQVLER